MTRYLAAFLLGLSLGAPCVAYAQANTDATVPAGLEFAVVRAYFHERAQVERLARDRAPWYVDIARTTSSSTSMRGYQRLLELGFRVEIDQELTQRYRSPPQALRGQVNGIPGFPCYRTVEETYASAQAIATEHPDLATWTDIGDSWEKKTGIGGYDLMVLKLSNSAVPGPKPRFFVMSAIHAREYATAELMTRFAEYLISNYGTDADATWLLDDHEIHFVLQANPDGRKQAESGQLWRKNTNKNYCGPNSSNRGADLNRNYPFEWNCCGGSSGNQCDGPITARSPPRSQRQAVRDYVRSIFRIRAPIR
jgi:hypothetical protein